jgi:thioredoxin reductase (NADPH)
MSTKPKHRQLRRSAEVIVVGGGFAGLSAAIYLGRAQRDTLLIDEAKSMGRWEPDIQNYLGFPEGISGKTLLSRAREQAWRYGLRRSRDHVLTARRTDSGFSLRGENRSYNCKRLLLATGIFHIPPDIHGVQPCLGHSLFFCKDCDGYRVRGKDIAIYGWAEEAVEYALSMLLYSSCVFVLTDGRNPRWSRKHSAWLREYKIPVYHDRIIDVGRADGQIQSVRLADGTVIRLDALFTTRGDVYFNKLAKQLGAKVDQEGQIIVGLDMNTSIAGLYAAGCVTPANCQMIVAAGQGAIAAQAINRDLFFESLATHHLRRFRGTQLQHKTTQPKTKLR